jgi:hypothetical protein
VGEILAPADCLFFPISSLAWRQPGGRSPAMCRKILFLLLLQPLLGACIGPDHLVASPPNDPSTVEENVSLREAERHYTHRQPVATKPEIVRIDIDERFGLYERAKILRAVNEWNLVLNGFVRLEIAPMMDGRPTAERPLSWKVVPAHEDKTEARRGALFVNALAMTYPLRRVGGMVIVYVDRLDGRDLTSVMRHELGHVLGLGHDPHSRLMSIRYTANNQQCIDKAAAEAIAASRGLRTSDLNWCEASTAADTTKSDL